MAYPPELFVIAGPNGAGKSTGAKAILPRHFPTKLFLNADEIARAIATDSPMEAARLMLKRMKTLRKAGKTFAFETTLAGKAHSRFLRDAREAGYWVHLAYTWLSSVDLAKKRVAVRVQRGGHDVPEDVIERRYRRGLRNYFQLFQPLASTWVLFDNSGSSLVTVARQRHGCDPEIFDENLYNRIRNVSAATSEG